MFNVAIYGQGAPRYLSTDHDPLFEAHPLDRQPSGVGGRRNQDGARCARIAPVCGTADWNDPARVPGPGVVLELRDLERKLAEFEAYYNEARSHASLEGRTPLGFAGGRVVPAPNLTRGVGRPTAGVSCSSQWRLDNEFETDRY